MTTEIASACTAGICALAAAYLVAGWNGVTWAAAGCTSVVMGVFVTLLVRSTTRWRAKPPTSLPSAWARHMWELESLLREGKASPGAFQSGLQPYLQRLVASRLAQQHGVDLYTEPEAARLLFCAAAGDERLWRWISPTAQGAHSQSRRGVPPRVLARIVRRLETL
jgi:uncharacterized membrane protein YtjA (UPF0391 family)